MTERLTFSFQCYISHSQVRGGITRVQTEITHTYDRLSEADWTLMAKVADYLKPFADFTAKGSSETACISEVGFKRIMISTYKVFALLLANVISEQSHLSICIICHYMDYSFSKLNANIFKTCDTRSLLYIRNSDMAYFQVIPYVKYLFFLLDKLPRRGVCMMRKRLIEETDRYFRGLDTRQHFPNVEGVDAYSLSTLLDPRFKKSGFSSQYRADAGIRKLERALSETVIETQSDDQPSSSGSSAENYVETDDWAICMGLDDPEVEFDQASAPSQADELSLYLAEKPLPRDKSPYSWWEVHEAIYPRLAKLARRYLSSPMSSIASEREFKLAKQIVTGRWTIKTETVEKMLFLKYNLRFLNYQY